MKIGVKRIYDSPASTDGYRVLVDRLWPRGVKKETAALDEWCKEIAPSPDLRQWFNHEPARFEEFKARYQEELAESPEPQRLLERAKDADTLTLVYAARDPQINHAVVLQDYLQSARYGGGSY